MTSLLFDHTLLAQRRNRAATHFADYRFLHDRVEDALLDRLADLQRQFPFAVNLGAADGGFSERLLGHNDIEKVFNIELSPALADLAQRTAPTVQASAEALPLATGQIPLIASALELQWSNDLVGALVQIRQALRPDGLFLGAMLGGETLIELRESFMQAELATTGVFASRFSPLASLYDMAGLLQRAGFTLPVVDREVITVTYRNPLRLLADLRGMGATNVTFTRHKKPLSRAVLAAVMEYYQQHYNEADGSGVRATFEVFYLSGWAPHESQQKPLPRGSGQISLKDVL